MSDRRDGVPQVSGAVVPHALENAWQGTCNPCPSATGGTNCPPMVDTLSLVCAVDQAVYDALVTASGRRLVIGPDGEVERDSPRIGSLPGSYDPNLWVQPWTVDGGLGIKLEGSTHRHVLGHNVFGGPTCPIKAARYMIATLERFLGLELPSWELWNVSRLDLAWVFDAGCENAALAFIVETGRSLATTTAARSLPRNFGTCVYSGRAKVYMKGPELRKHMPAHLSKPHRNHLLTIASSLLRFEVTFHTRDISRLTYSNLSTLELGPLIRQAHKMLNTLSRSTDDAMQTVRTTTSVQSRLSDLYPSSRAAALMGTWFKLTTLGESATRAGMTTRTYYRHVSELKAAGVSWTGTDVVRIHSLAFPQDFTLSLNSPYLVRTGEHPQVTERLAPYALAAA